MDRETNGLNYLMFFDPYGELQAKRVHLKSFDLSAFAFKNPCSKSLSRSWSFIPPSAIALAVSFGKPYLSHPLFTNGLQSVSSSYTFMQDKWAWETSVDALCGSIAPYAFKYSHLNAKWAWETSADALLESAVDKPSSRKMNENLTLSVNKSNAPPIASRSSPQVGTVSEPTSLKLTSCKTSPAIDLPAETSKLVIPTIIVTPPAEEESKPATIEWSRPKFAIPTIVITPPDDEVTVSERATFESEVLDLTSVKSVEMSKPPELKPVAPKKLSGCQKRKKRAAKTKTVASLKELCDSQKRTYKLILPVTRTSSSGKSPKPLRAGKKAADKKVISKAITESQPSASAESSKPCDAVQATAEPAAIEANKPKLVIPAFTPPQDNVIESKPATSIKLAKATVESAASSTGNNHEAPESEVATGIVTPPSTEVSSNNEPASAETRKASRIEIPAVIITPPCDEPPLESSTPDKATKANTEPAATKKTLAIVVPANIVTPSENKTVAENESISVESKNTATETSKPESSTELATVECVLDSTTEGVESESASIKNEASELLVTPKKLSGCQKKKKRAAKAKIVMPLEEICESQKKTSKLILPVTRKGRSTSGKSPKPLRVLAGKKGQSSRM